MLTVEELADREVTRHQPDYRRRPWRSKQHLLTVDDAHALVDLVSSYIFRPGETYYSRER